MTTPGPTSNRPGLLRAMGRWDLTAGVVNGVIGSGIFGLPSVLAGHLGTLSPLAFVLGGLAIFTVVLCFAEVASRFEDGGGPYLYVRETFGPVAGFQVGWLHLWTRVLSAAAVVNLFGSYLAQLVPATATGWGRALALTALVGLLAALNVIGVRQATWAVNLFTIAKLLPLGLLVVLGLPRIHSDVLATQAVAAPDWPRALVLVVFACGGFESAVIPAGEAQRPKRDMAFALVVAMAGVVVLYSLVQLVVVGCVPHAASVGATPLSAAFRALLGPPGGLAATLAVLISTYGWTSGFVLATPRILLSMAQRGEVPRVLGAVHRRFRTPHVAILANAALALGLAVYGTFAWAATISVLTRLLVYLPTCGALLIFRARRPDQPPRFRLPGGVAVAWLGIAFCLWLLATRAREQIWILLAILATGLAASWLARVDSAKRTRTMDHG
jgi:APA family basic amino acid/polyamine antiporter